MREHTIERPVSPTILRLRHIKPGQRVIYYRGTLEDDLAYAQGNYRALLEDIKDEAQRLYREGRADITTERVKREKTFGKRQPEKRTWTENIYVAVGV